MNIYVLRHGQTDYNVRNVYQGQIDVPLNDVGIEQAKEIAKKFNGIKVDAILVSPLTRAKQTAQYVSEVTKVPIVIEKDLIERSFGDMEGHHNREDCNIQMLSDYDKNYNIFNVEPIQELFKRVYSYMDSVVKRFKDKDIVIVTHACVAQAIECYCKGMPKDKDILSLALKNGEVRKYTIERQIDIEER